MVTSTFSRNRFNESGCPRFRSAVVRLCTLVALGRAELIQQSPSTLLFSNERARAIPQLRMANMIVTTTRITVSSANRSELFQTVLTLLTPVMNEKGCLSSRFYLDTADSNSAMLVEEWDTQEDWDNHLQSRDCRRHHRSFQLSDGLLGQAGLSETAGGAGQPTRAHRSPDPTRNSASCQRGQRPPGFQNERPG